MTIKLLATFLLVATLSASCSHQSKDKFEKQKEELLKDDRQIIILHNNANDTIYAWLNMCDMDLFTESPDGSPGLIIAPHDSISSSVHLNYFDLTDYFEISVLRKSVLDTLSTQAFYSDTTYSYSLDELRRNSFSITVQGEDLKPSE